MTPFIPCGPLYLLLGVTLASANVWDGFLLALSFGLGTVPLLFLAHTQMGRVQLRLGTKRSRWLRQGLSLIAALLVLMRLSSLQASDDDTGRVEGPNCCQLEAFK